MNGSDQCALLQKKSYICYSSSLSISHNYGLDTCAEERSTIQYAFANNWIGETVVNWNTFYELVCGANNLRRRAKQTLSRYARVF